MPLYNKYEGSSAIVGLTQIFNTISANIFEVYSGVTYSIGNFDVNNINTSKRSTTYRIDMSNRLKRHQIARTHQNISINSGKLFADRLEHLNYFAYQDQNFTDNIPAGVTFSQSAGINAFKDGEISILPAASGNAFVVDRVGQMRNGHVLMLFRTSAYSVSDGRYVQFRFRYNGETDTYQLLTFQRDATNNRRMKLQGVFYGGLTTLATYTDSTVGSQFNSTASHWVDLWADEGRLVVGTGSFAGQTPTEIVGLSKIFDLYADKYTSGIMEFDIPTGDSTSIMAFAYQSMEEPMIPADALKYSLALAGTDTAVNTGVTTEYNTVGYTWSTLGFTFITTNNRIRYEPVDTGTSFSILKIGYSTLLANDANNLRFNKRGGFAVDFNFYGASGNYIGIGVSPYYSWFQMGGGSSSGVIQYNGATYTMRNSAGMIHTTRTEFEMHRMRMYVTSRGSIFWYVDGRAWDMVLGYSLSNYLFPVEEIGKKSIEIIEKGFTSSSATGLDSIVFYPDIRISDDNLNVTAGSQLSSMSDEFTGDGYLVSYGASSVNLIDLADRSNDYFAGVTYSIDQRFVENVDMDYNRQNPKLTVGYDPYNPRFTWMGYTKTDAIFLEPLATTITQSTLNVDQLPVDNALLQRAEKQLSNEVYTIALNTIDPRIEIGDRLRLVSSREDFELNNGKEVVVLSYNKSFNAEDGSASMSIEAGAITLGVTINNVIGV